MEKKILLLTAISLFVLCNSSTAQVEYWGVRQGDNNNAQDFGTIFKVDSNGENYSAMHQFDSINGSFPYGSLFQASNGKIYGNTFYGGSGVGGPSLWSGGVLFEYDLTIDSFRVIVNYDSQIYPYEFPMASFIEPKTGQLYFCSSASILKYNHLTEQLSLIANLPTIPNSPTGNQNSGNLILASNGKLYGAAKYSSITPLTAPYIGLIYSIDTTTNVLNSVYPFSTNIVLGKNPNGNLVQWLNGKLYGTCLNGGINDFGPFNPNHGGVIFEFDPLNNAYTKKFDFDSISGSFPSELILANNNKLYGLTGNGGSDSLGNHFGTLFEYDPATNNFLKKHDFGIQNTAFPPIETGTTPTGYLLQSSNGKLYGLNQGCIFEYNYNTSTLRATHFYYNTSPNAFNPGKSLIEICRKPSYKYFYTDTFTVCKNNSFTYTLHSTNASSYQWNVNGTVIAAQADSILAFASIQLADSGIYTCTMQNQCGQTTTMNLVVKVSTCSGIDEQFGIANAIVIAPNPANDFIQLQIADNNITKIKQVVLKNMLGQHVIQLDNGAKNINVSKLPHGMYLVEAQTNKGLWVGKVMKE